MVNSPKPFSSRRDIESGFTLIELLVVILIVGILAAIAIPLFLNQRKSAVDSTVKSDVVNAAKQVETWVTKQGATKKDIPLTETAIEGTPLADIKASDGTALRISGTSERFYVHGTNTGGDVSAADGFLYDSGNGGLQRNTSTLPPGESWLNAGSPIDMAPGGPVAGDNSQTQVMIFRASETRNAYDTHIESILSAQGYTNVQNKYIHTNDKPTVGELGEAKLLVINTHPYSDLSGGLATLAVDFHASGGDVLVQSAPTSWGKGKHFVASVENIDGGSGAQRVAPYQPTGNQLTPSFEYSFSGSSELSASGYNFWGCPGSLKNGAVAIAETGEIMISHINSTWRRNCISMFAATNASGGQYVQMLGYNTAASDLAATPESQALKWLAKNP